MRTIKFRGKRIDNGEWVCGNLINKFGSSFIGVYTFDVTGEYVEYEVIPETVGQFTGLTDKNGKEIYNGDVFNLGDARIKYIVEWKDSGFKGRQIGNRSRVGLEFHKRFIEVIGSIHDNPELLKGE